VADGVRDGAAAGDGAADEARDECADDRMLAGAPAVASAEADRPPCADVLTGLHDATASAKAAMGTTQITGLDRNRMTTSPRQPVHRARFTAAPIHPGTSSIRQPGRYGEIPMAGYRSAAAVCPQPAGWPRC